ncbi:MAG: hypothetical protein LIO68_07370 [Rikenellaceae bacterium]|nr:hypothetical protein [Rikenellaceae bacterium]
MNAKNFTANFKSLVIRLAIGMAASVVVTGIACGLLHLGFWNYWWTLITGGIIGAILMWNRYQTQQVVFWIGTALIALPAAATQYAVYYTEDRPEQLASLADYDQKTDHHRYVDFDEWYYNTDNMGAVEITTEYKRRGRTTGSSKRVYVAVPMYADSLSTEPKVWMALDFPTAAYDAVETENDLIRFDEILCFEKLSPSLVDDFRSAIDYCDSDSLKTLRDEAVFITPLYEAFTPRSKWILWSTYVLLGAIAGLALLSLFVRGPQEENEPDAPVPQNE